MTRLLDIVGSAVLLVALSPLLLLATLAIRLDSPGPALFRQERIGWEMRPFRILKLRTMTIVAEGEAGFDLVPARVTRLGGWLRRWKLDEIPQLWNVLRGEMSLVGPRPEIRRYVEMFPAEFEVLLRRRPGMADPASIAYRHESRLLASESDPEAAYVGRILPDKIRLSREYAERRTLVADLAVLARAVRATLDPEA